MCGHGFESAKFLIWVGCCGALPEMTKSRDQCQAWLWGCPGLAMGGRPILEEESLPPMRSSGTQLLSREQLSWLFQSKSRLLSCSICYRSPHEPVTLLCVLVSEGVCHKHPLDKAWIASTTPSNLPWAIHHKTKPRFPFSENESLNSNNSYEECRVMLPRYPHPKVEEGPQLHL